MGKHRTAQQDAIIVAFMERHPIIAKNYYKGDKLASEAAWKRLSKELNSVGPPVKEATEWKRVWKDWKTCIRKKISMNRLEDANATGKNSLYQDTLTPLEDAVATICDLYEMVEKQQPRLSAGRRSGGDGNSSPHFQNIKTDRDAASDIDEDDDDEEEDEEEELSTSGRGAEVEHQTNTNTPTSSAKRRRVHDDPDLGDSESKVPLLMDISKELRELNRQTRLNAQRAEANTEALLALGTQISDLMHQQLKERKRLNSIMEKFVLKMETND
ncbi:kinesin-like protein KIF3B [Drosophila willistoni]|nr:kinesin-like protein KIF3B [Drosophila willistoni]